MSAEEGHTPIRCDRCRTIHMVPPSRLGQEANCRKCGAPLATQTATGVSAAPPPPRRKRREGSARKAPAPPAPRQPPRAGPSRGEQRRRQRRITTGLLLVVSLAALVVAGLLFARVLWSSVELTLDLGGAPYRLEVTELGSLQLDGDSAEPELRRSTLSYDCVYRIEEQGEDGVARSAAVRLVSFREISPDAEGEAAGDSASLAGMRFALARSAHGFEVTPLAPLGDASPPADLVSRASLQFEPDPFRGAYSSGPPLAKGVEWTVTARETLAELAPHGDVDVQSGSCRLHVDSFQRRGDGRVCKLISKIEMVLLAVLGEREVELRAEGTGEAILDLDHGVILEREESLELEGQGVTGTFRRQWKARVE